jgi:hypothetical protein
MARKIYFEAISDGMLSMLILSKNKLKTRKKGRKKTTSDELAVPSVQASVHFVHCTVDKMKMSPLDDLTV